MNTLKAKILSIVMVLAIGMVFVASVGIYQLNKFAADSAAVVDRLKQVVALVDTSRSAQHHFKVQVQEWKNILIRGGDSELYDKYLKSFEKEETLVNERLAKFREIAAQLQVSTRLDTRAAEAALKELGGSYRQALKAHDRTRPDFTQATDREVRGKDRQVDALIDGLDKEAKKLADEIEAESLAAMASQSAATRNNLIFLSLLFMAFGVGLSLLIANGMIRRVLAVESSIKSVESTHDLTVQVEMSGQDELSRIGRSFNSMMRDFREVLGKVRQSAESVSAASNQLSGTSETLSHSANTQSEAVLTSAAAVEELTVSIAVVSSNADSVRQHSIESMKETLSGTAMVEQMVEEIRSVQTSVNAMAESIQAFVSSTQTISGMTQQVKEIADQTNLLALNAAIEAARAGEFGRGFAVVADEVGKLAEKSGKSAIQIDTVTQQIQRQSAQVASSIQLGLASIERSVVKAGEVTSVLHHSRDTVEKANEGVREIAASVKEQESVSAEIAQNMERISVVTDQTASASREARQSAASLLMMADDLNQLVQRFKT